MVYPAVDLLSMTKPSCSVVVIDKGEVVLPQSVLSRKKVQFIGAEAAKGLNSLFLDVRRDYYSGFSGLYFKQYPYQNVLN